MRYALLLPVAAVGGCSGLQSALDPAGPFAENLDWLWWVFFWTCTAVFVIVAALVVIALMRRANTEFDDVPGKSENPRAIRTVLAGGVATAVILVLLLFATVATTRANDEHRGRDPLHVEVIARQYWWDFIIHGDTPSQMVRVANELHIPAGRPVRLELKSHDVIHSFWVPRLQGKMDAIPGRTNEIWIEASSPGVYRGQCAELCGVQHANMAMIVIAEPEAEFEQWRRGQLAPAAEPQFAMQERGRDVFLSGPCAVCHAIRGTPAGGRVAPDLTHVASRRTLASATIPNTRGHLAGWVLDSQHVKPGNHMPPIQLPAEDLTALLTYLESLE